MACILQEAAQYIGDIDKHAGATAAAKRADDEDSRPRASQFESRGLDGSLERLGRARGFQLASKVLDNGPIVVEERQSSQGPHACRALVRLNSIKQGGTEPVIDHGPAIAAAQKVTGAIQASN